MEEKSERYLKQEQREKFVRYRRRSVLRKRHARLCAMAACAFLVVMLLIILGNVLHKNRDYSESENRVLAQRPTFTAASLESGAFMEDVEDFVSDQFILRDQWISLSVLENLALGIRESNGVYIGKKNYLFEISDEPNQDAIDNNLTAIANLAAAHQDINTVMTLVPNSIYILDQLLPVNAPVRDQSADIAYAEEKVGDSVRFVNLIEPLSAHKEEYIYYKTDHHWTTLGASYAFEAMSEALQIEGSAIDYHIYPVTHNFTGTLASTSGYTFDKDTINIYAPIDNDVQCLVTYVDDGTKAASVYDTSALDGKNKYEVFLGGNYARIDIATTSESEKNLLLFKDSYANCLIPFLLPYYQNIIVIDPRYSYESATSLISDNSITDILFLYNVNTFLTDTSLADILEEESEETEEGSTEEVQEESGETEEVPAEDSAEDSE